MALNTFLLIEDEDNVAIAIEMLLRAEGFEVHRAATATDGYNWLMANRPDAVIIDSSLPDQTGYGLCQKVRLNQSIPRLPILLMTNRASPVPARKAAAMGADVSLSKPFDLDRFRATLQQLKEVSV